MNPITPQIRAYVQLAQEIEKAEFNLRGICNSKDEYETTKEYCRKESITTLKSYLEVLNDRWHTLNMQRGGP